MKIAYIYGVKSVCLHIFLLTLLPLSLSAQENEDYKDYAHAAGSGLPLYRARVADVYPHRYNGTYLIDNQGFLPGDLCYEGKTYSGLLLQVDAFTQHVLVRQEGSPIVLDLGRDQIDWFTRGGGKFINLPAMGCDVPEGFYEEMETGRGAVYRRVDKLLRTLPDVNASAREYIGYPDPDYKQGLLDYYERKETWYQVREDGTVRRLRGKRSINKAMQYVRSQVAH